MKKTFFIISLCALLATQSYAGTIASGDDCGEDCHWSLSEDGTLSITGTGLINHSTNSSSSTLPWISYSNQVKNVEIGSGITEIGARSFYGMGHIENINISDTVKKIEIGAFFRSGVKSINIPNSVEYIGDSAFGDLGQGFSMRLEKVVAGDAFFNTFGSRSSVQEGTSVSAFISQRNIKEFYCPEKYENICKSIFSLTGSSEEALKIYQETADGKYVVDGKKYGSLSDLQNGIVYVSPGKRIYTVEEASKVSKKTGNRFMIRYK